MERITVRKLDHKGSEVISYPGQVLKRAADAIVLRTSWDREPMELGFVTLEPEDRWTEYFYSNRWYNIFEIRASNGRLKGWYCNITRPARIGEEAVTAEDLALDLWVAPDRSTKVLDADEFAELPLEPGERQAARRALADLQSMIAEEAPPFNR